MLLSGKIFGLSKKIFGLSEKYCLWPPQKHGSHGATGRSFQMEMESNNTEKRLQFTCSCLQNQVPAD